MFKNINRLELNRCKLYFNNYYLMKLNLLKESTRQIYNIDLLMLVTMEEFPAVIYFFNYFWNRKPKKYIKKIKYGQKQEKLPLKVQFNKKQQFNFLFFYRYFLSILLKRNKQLFLLKEYEHKITITIMELSILFKNQNFLKTIDFYSILSDLVIDIYIQQGNEKKIKSCYYSLFRYNFN